MNFAMMGDKFEVLLTLISAVVLLSCTSTAGITPVTKLLIDGDTGGDDMISILMAIQAERLDNGPTIVGITCVNGNANVEQVALNVLKTLKVAARLDIPVYIGAAHPLVLATTTDYYYGVDGFGDFEYPNPPSMDLIQSKHAVNAMIDLVKEYPGEVTLLALGPLTNVALAIRMYPKFLDELQQIIVMGGSTDGRGNVRPGMEFNFAADPVANYVVFNSINTSNPVNLVSLETTKITRPTIDFRMSLSKTNGTYAWLMDKVGSRGLKSKDGYWNCPDVVATAVALTSGSIVTKSEAFFSAAVHEGALTSGMIIVDYINRTGNAANTNLIQGLNSDVFEQLLSRYLKV